MGKKGKTGATDLPIPDHLKERLAAFVQQQTTTTEGTGAEEERIEQLEKDLQVLSKKCSALEAQNILVPVQQLDLFARATALCCSFGSLLVYWRLVWWIMKLLPVIAKENVAPMLIRYEPALFLVNNAATWWIVRVAALVFPYLYNRWTHGSFHRRFEVFAIAFVVIARVRLCRYREQLFMNPDQVDGGVANFGEASTEEGIWEANYEISARFLYVSILRLKGLWTKTAQYMSSRADFMPTAYVRELRRLQDEAPATEWKHVAQMLPRAIRAELDDIDVKPLASASIGQVHTARLRSTGAKVVIKVQHPHARTLILDDFWSLAVILRITSWLEPDYVFLEILMREWSQEARKELDFVSEAENLGAAQASIHRLLPTQQSVVLAQGEEAKVPFFVEIPRPIKGLCNNNILVMSFCQGVRVDDFDRLDEWKLSKSAIVNAVSQTFAHMMYVTDVFNGDPHPGNVFVRPGTPSHKSEGFTLVLLDWGLAKRLPDKKRLAFCQMVYAASTFDYGLLLDSYKTIGLKMKRENTQRSMAEIRFLLRDMAPRERSRKRIKARIKSDTEHYKSLKKEDRVPMESKAYPGEFFFFVRVNELLHGLGSRFEVDMAYLDILRPYAEKGLRQFDMYNRQVTRPLQISQATNIDCDLEEKLRVVLDDAKKENLVEGAQLYVVDKQGRTVVDVVAGSLGGLKGHLPMQCTALVLGYSCTKAIAATLAHIMVQAGYLSYDEPLAERVWPAFCPTEKPPVGLEDALSTTREDVQSRWHWKRQISLWHILTHQAGLWAALPAKLTIKNMASCEYCVQAFEFNEESLEDTLLPNRAPGEQSEYHFMSFGWLVAGALCGAYAKRHEMDKITFKEVYEALLFPRLSSETTLNGFHPCGGLGEFAMAQTVTSTAGASKMLQQRQESSTMGEDESTQLDESLVETMKAFKGKEFLLDPRIWNSVDAIDSNVPAAGGRFSAAALAHFYHDLGSGRIIDKAILDQVTEQLVMESKAGSLQGATSMTHDSESERTALGCGYQLIRFDRDTIEKPSSFGHAGIGGSIGLHHKEKGLSMALMLNKADGGKDLTMRIMKVVGDHFSI